MWWVTPEGEGSGPVCERRGPGHPVTAQRLAADDAEVGGARGSIGSNGSRRERRQLEALRQELHRGLVRPARFEVGARELGLEPRGEGLGVVGANAEDDLGPDVAEHRCLHVVIELRKELVRENEPDAVLAALGEQDACAVTGKALELVEVEVERTGVHGPAERGQLDEREEDAADERAPLVAKLTDRELGEDDAAAGKDVRGVEPRAFGREETRDGPRRDERAELVQDRRQGLGLERLRVARPLAEPEGSDERVGRALDDLLSQRLVDEEPVQEHHRRARMCGDREGASAQDVFETRPPGVFPDAAETRDELGREPADVRMQRSSGAEHVERGHTGRAALDEDHVLGARARNEAKHLVHQAAMWVKEREPVPAGEVLGNLGEHERRLPHAGLAEDVDVTETVRRFEPEPELRSAERSLTEQRELARWVVETNMAVIHGRVLVDYGT